jgi:hypothetical protein
MEARQLVFRSRKDVSGVGNVDVIQGTNRTGIRPRHGTRQKLLCSALVGLLALGGCGYRFSGAPDDTPFPRDIRTIEVRSAINKTTITGIETELTNDLRTEFAVGTRLKAVRSGGDVILNTVISSYEETPPAYTAEGKELTRNGTLRIACSLERADNKKILWEKTLSSSLTYLVSDTVAETLTNRRRAISEMIRDLITHVQRSLYENF